MESIEPNKIEVGDIFSTFGIPPSGREDTDKTLIMVANIICDGEPGRKVVNSSWGTRHYNSDGCSLNYTVSLDNGDTWNYEDGEGHYVDTGWIGELVKMGHWVLEHKNVELDSDFFDSLNESEKNQGNYDCVGINLSNLTTDEKIKVLEKLEQVYNTFVGFSRYAWVDQIQYLVTDFITPVTVSLTLASLKGRIGKCGRYFTSVPENAYKEETDSYETPISMGGTKLRWSKEIDGREFLNMPSIDDTSKLFESDEDEFKWVEDIINDMSIKLGDVFYIVDSDYAGSQHPIGYRPENVRYTLFVSDIFQDDEDKYIEYIECDNRNVSYNPKDFNTTKCERSSTTVTYEKALKLINQNYWRPMGNNGYYNH